MFPRPDKWTAFLLSLAVPGAGQLCAGSVTCLAWFLAAGLLAWFWIVLQQESWNAALIGGQFVTLMLLGVCSAEHAKRLLEPRGTKTSRSAGGTYQVCRTRRRGRGIEIRVELAVPLSSAELWKRVSDLPAFLTIDPFHERVVLMRDKPAAGVDLVLWHNAFGRRFARFGRILSWREGEGYTFSDLSQHGPRCGFPHVFCIAITPGGERGHEDRLKPELQHSRLSIAVRGKWTSPLVPVFIGRGWIWLVCREHARLLRKGL
jgi:hypothetical protein